MLAGCAGGGTGSANLVVPQAANPNGSASQSIARHLAPSYSVLPPSFGEQLLPPAIAAPVTGFGKAGSCPKEDVGFISDTPKNIVYETNATGKCATLTGFDYPQGIAVDRRGTLWVANTYGHNILAFKPPYNGKPSTTLNDPGYYPVDVCVDLNGNVAVMNISALNDGPGNVLFYARGSVNPTGAASNKDFRSPRFCAFTHTGILVFDDYNGAANLGRIFNGNVRNMNAVIRTLKTTNVIANPGGVQINDAGGMAVLDQTGRVIDNYRNPERLDLGAPISVTPLGGATTPVQFQLTPGSKGALVADAGSRQAEAYSYPDGGDPLNVFKFKNGGVLIGVGYWHTEQFVRFGQ